VGIGGGKTATDPRITTATMFFQVFEIEVRKKQRKGLTMYLINQDDSRRKYSDYGFSGESAILHIM
jgi:hypothetical protein